MDKAGGKLIQIFEEMDQKLDGELPITVVFEKFQQHMQIESILDEDL